MIELLTSPQAWAAFVALATMEIVLGIDNLIFISIITDKLPKERQAVARKIGIGLALILRLALLSVIAWIVSLTAPVFDLGLTGALNDHGEPSFETEFSWRDLILIGGGVFLVFKATMEIHEKVASDHHQTATGAATITFAAAITQIVALDAVFSMDSILTAVGMTDEIPIMVAAVVLAVTVMFLAAEPVSNFVNKNPTVVMLALSFLLMIGMVLIADGFGVHVPKGYIYGAMAFAAFVEVLNMFARRRRMRKAG